MKLAGTSSGAPAVGRWRRHSLTIALATLLTAAAVEQSYRFYLFGPASLDVRKMDSLANIGFSGFIQPSPTPGLLYELKPNIDSFFKLASFRTNSRGLRDREYDTTKASDVFRVAVVGSSFTMASGVEIEDAYHSLLEERLTARGDANYEFINFGVGGYGPDALLAVLRHKALDYGPDLVLFALTLETANIFFAEEKIPVYEGRRREHTFFRLFSLEPVKRRIYSPPEESYYVSRQEASRRLSRALDDLAEMSRETSIPVWVCVLWHRHSGLQASHELAERARARGFHTIETTQVFADLPFSRVRIHRLDRHPNKLAHARFADVLQPHFDERLAKLAR